MPFLSYSFCVSLLCFNHLKTLWIGFEKFIFLATKIQKKNLFFVSFSQESGVCIRGGFWDLCTQLPSNHEHQIHQHRGDYCMQIIAKPG